MKNVFKSPKIYMVAGLAVIVVTASAWQLKTKRQPGDTTAASTYAGADTTKSRKHGADKAGDGMKELNNGFSQADGDNDNITINLDGLDTCIEKTINEAMKGIDVNGIVNEALRAVKNVDWDEINREVNLSLKEAQKEIKNIDVEDIKLELQKAKDEIRREEMKDIPDSARLHKIIEDALRNVKVDIRAGRRA